MKMYREWITREKTLLHQIYFEYMENYMNETDEKNRLARVYIIIILKIIYFF